VVGEVKWAAKVKGGEVGSKGEGRVWYGIEGQWGIEEVQPGMTRWVAGGGWHGQQCYQAWSGQSWLEF